MSGNKKHGCSHTRAVEYNTPQDDDSKIVQFVKRTRLSKKRESTVHSIEHRAASHVIPIVSSTNVIPIVPLRSVLSSEITETITPTLIPFSASASPFSSSSSSSAASSSRANSNDQLLNNKRKKQKHQDDDKIDARVNPRKKRHLTRVRNSTQTKKKKQDTRKNRQEQKTKETEKEQEVDMLSVHNKKDRDEKITNSEPSRLASTIPPPPPLPIPTPKTTSSREDEVASHKSRYKVAIDMIGQKFFEPLRRKLAERIANLINVSTMQTQTYDTFLRDDVPTIMRNSELLIDYIPDADRIDDEDDEASNNNNNNNNGNTKSSSSSSSVRLPVFSASSPSSSSSSSSSSTPSHLIVPVTTNPTPNKKYGSSHAALAAAAAATEMNTRGELHVLG